jgi:hypothetical protein
LSTVGAGVEKDGDQAFGEMAVEFFHFTGQINNLQLDPILLV